MNRITTIIHKPGIFMKARDFKSNTSGQTGGIVGFFIGAMIAVIVALQVTWPVIDQVLNVGNATANMTGAAVTLLGLIPLFLVLSVVMIFIRPLL